MTDRTQKDLLSEHIHDRGSYLGSDALLGRLTLLGVALIVITRRPDPRAWDRRVAPMALRARGLSRSVDTSVDAADRAALERLTATCCGPWSPRSARPSVLGPRADRCHPSNHGRRVRCAERGVLVWRHAGRAGVRLFARESIEHTRRAVASCETPTGWASGLPDELQISACAVSAALSGIGYAPTCPAPRCSARIPSTPVPPPMSSTRAAGTSTHPPCCAC